MLAILLLLITMAKVKQQHQQKYKEGVLQVAVLEAIILPRFTLHARLHIACLLLLLCLFRAMPREYVDLCTSLQHKTLTIRCTNNHSFGTKSS
jgi:hypothetical protein